MMIDNKLGFIDTPAQGNRRPAGVTWAADNGCYGKGWPGEDAWWTWLENNAMDAARCAFAVAPDVVGDAQATLARSLPWLPRIRALGYPVAFAAQDGLTTNMTPWDEIDVLFIGGMTRWKLGPEAHLLILEAKQRGKRVHMGRVNSACRWRYAEAVGCDTADGTYLTFGPAALLPNLMGWISEVPLPLDGRWL